MAKPDNMTGNEFARYLDASGALLSVRDDGTTWGQTIHKPTWRRIASKKPEIDLERWKLSKLERVAALDTWRTKVKALPSMRSLERWTYDSVCKTPTGHTVEPDGHGPDGVPSWLLILGMI